MEKWIDHKAQLGEFSQGITVCGQDSFLRCTSSLLLLRDPRPSCRTCDKLTKARSPHWSSSRCGSPQSPPACGRQIRDKPLHCLAFQSCCYFHFQFLSATCLLSSSFFGLIVYCLIYYYMSSPGLCSFFECVACVVIHSEGPLIQRKFPRRIFTCPLHMTFVSPVWSVSATTSLSASFSISIYLFWAKNRTWHIACAQIFAQCIWNEALPAFHMENFGFFLIFEWGQLSSNIQLLTNIQIAF